MDISERIQILRKHLKMSRRAFGETLGVSESVIVNIEFDRLKRPDQKEPIYKLICEKFDVNEDWLRNGTGEMFVQLSLEEEIAEFVGELLKDKNDSFKKKFIGMLCKLDEAGWEALECVAKSMGEIKNG
jgi:transcriptional regulator with XRE-family HTH domain